MTRRRSPDPAWLEDALQGAPPILTIGEAVALTRLSARTLRRYSVAGRIATIRASRGRGPARLLFPRAEVARLLREMAA